MSDSTRQTRLLRRYWPFLVVVAVQLVLAAVAPSTGHSTLSQSGQVALGTVIQPDAAGSGTTGGGSDPTTPGADPVTGATAGATAGSADPGAIAGTSAGPGAGTSAPGAVAGQGTISGSGQGPTVTPGGNRAPTARGATAKPSGTTTIAKGGKPPTTKTAASAGPGSTAAGPAKCVPGQPQQTVTSQSPPCLAAIPASQNGGATATGVTATTINVVLYQAKVNPTVNAVEAGAGLGEDPAKQAVAVAAFTNFFNSHYELAGRHIVMQTFTGTCTVDPPDDTCLRADADTLVSTMHPFWVLWPTARPSFMDELSKLGVLNSGGLTFSGAFNRAHAPYHYSAFTSGDRMAKAVAAFWCNRLAGKDATLAGDTTMHTQTRKLGILVREEPANEQAAELLASLVSGGAGSLCNGPKPTLVTFSQDITTAQEQSSTAIATLRQAGVTTVASISSALELVLQMNGFASNGYLPENLLVGTGLVDQDAAGRLVNQQEWAHAFGLGDDAGQVPADQTDSTKAFDAGGQTGTPYAQAALTFAEEQLMVWQLQAAAGKLDAVDVAKATFSMQVIGDYNTDGRNPKVVRWQVTNDDYSGPDDGRQLYWSTSATSSVDGQTGAYIDVDGGRRYVDGTFPAGDPEKP